MLDNEFVNAVARLGRWLRWYWLVVTSAGGSRLPGRLACCWLAEVVIVPGDVWRRC